MPRYDALPVNLPPCGLSRDTAAQYIGISVGKFDELVADGRMPKPVRIAFNALGNETVSRNPWDELLRNNISRIK